MRKKIILTVLIIFSFFIGRQCVLYYPFQLSKSKAEIEIRHMKYACGNCYPQYRIERIIIDPEKKISKFLNWEILVYLRGENFEYESQKKIKNDCFNQYTFILKGTFKKKLIYAFKRELNSPDYNGLYFDADSAKALLTEQCDKKVQKEINL
jgi:hypothetical protein